VYIVPYHINYFSPHLLRFFTPPVLDEAEICKSLTPIHAGNTLYIRYREETAMIKRLVSHGNSAALIIDKPILELLNVDMETPLEITTDGKSLIISPVESAGREKEFKAAMQKVNKKHGRTLRKLAR